MMLDDATVFGLSKFGKSVVVSEGQLLPVRLGFTLFTLVLGACALLHVTIRFFLLLRRNPR
jgi:hypothetical protein